MNEISGRDCQQQTTSDANRSESCSILYCSNCSSTKSDIKDNSLLILPTELLITILSFLPAYDKLTVRITCKRWYSIVSDPHAWRTVVWKEFPRIEKYYKALNLSLKLARSSAESISMHHACNSMLSGARFPISKFHNQIKQCKQVTFLNMTGIEMSTSILLTLVSSLPKLYSLSVITGDRTTGADVVNIASQSKSLHILSLTCDQYKFNMFNTWQNCDYSPPDLRVRGSLISHWFNVFNSLKHYIPPDHPARLSVYTDCPLVVGNTSRKHPLLEMSFSSSASILTCVSDSLGLASTHRSIVTLSTSSLSSDTCVSAMYISSIPPLTFFNSSFSSLPQSLQHLSLACFKQLTSTHLTIISESCPNLIRLDITGCEQALLVLKGLADIGLGCSKLSSLCLMDIVQRQVESVTILWEILATMIRLKHLAMSHCLMNPDRRASSISSQQKKRDRVSYLGHVNTESQQQIFRSASQLSNLVAFETAQNIVDPITGRTDTNFLLVLSAFRSLKHLRVLDGVWPIFFSNCLAFTDILPSYQHLTYLYISVPSQQIILPSDPSCYHSLQQLYIHCPQFFLSENVAQSILYHKMLTHVYLHLKTSTTTLKHIVLGLPGLVECHLVINSNESKLRLEHAKSQLLPMVKSRGLNYHCTWKPCVGIVPEIVIDCGRESDLGSLWAMGTQSIN